MDHLLTTATSKDERDRAAHIAVLPVGSFEQHGDHLPLSTDTIVACVLAREIAAAYDLWLLPPITISCSHEHAAWPGTVSISARTLYDVVVDIAQSAAQNGAGGLLIVNGHGGNYVLGNVAQEANVAGPQIALFPSRDDWDSARVAAGLQTTSREDMHGGELEVSVLLHACPELVDSEAGGADHFAPVRPLMSLLGFRGYTSSGIIGRPSLASADAGKLLVRELVSRADAHLAVLRSP